MEWQDISTAPKDGTRVDLWMVSDSGRQWRETDAYWVTQRNDERLDFDEQAGCYSMKSRRFFKRDGWYAPNHDDDGQDGWCDWPPEFNMALKRVAFIKATHWMPLPPPPPTL